MPSCGPNGCTDEDEVIPFLSLAEVMEKLKNEDHLLQSISPPPNIETRPFTKEESETLNAFDNRATYREHSYKPTPDGCNECPFSEEFEIHQGLELGAIYKGMK